MLKVDDIYKSYGTKGNPTQVLRGISFDIADGDFVVLLGASGSGKSTLLHVMSGLERPDKGEILYDGENITALSDRQLTDFRKKNIGFIFQQYYLLPGLTVDKNVKMGAQLAENKDYEEIIEAVGLKEERYKYPHELSGGQQQRVSVARALAKKPRILFLDEPTGALDEETGRSVLAYIADLQRKLAFTVVMVTHNMNIADMAGTVVRINSGKIVEMYENKTRKNAYEIGW